MRSVKMKTAAPENHRPARVLIVDDHPIVREGLSSLISRQSDLVVCGECEDVQSTLRLIDETKPDVVTIDISLKSGSGLDLIRRIAGQNRSIRLIVCSLHDELLYGERALNAGAMGYVNKHEATRTIVSAIRQTLGNKVYLSERMSQRIAHQLMGGGASSNKHGIESLSERELEVFQLIGGGLTTTQISRKLNIGIKTVETHRRRIKEKLSIENTAQLAREAAQWMLESN